ncbi:MAG: ATP-binding protein [Thermodesulfobacteriota bacterium]|nr:ATP-binding protein [Thermodesulfobacteriota bacterium]
MNRHSYQLLQELLQFFPCVAIVGVRQCGKTTLLRRLSSKWKLYDLEKVSDFQTISRDPDLFLRLNSQYCAIDESQLLPELFSALRVAIDDDRQQPGRFIITGSSSPDLLHSISESLAGRVGIIELSPFSLSEAFSLSQSIFFNKIVEQEPPTFLGELEPRVSLSDVHDYWLRGGYPEPWIRNSARFAGLWRQNYFETYMNRDVMRLFPGLNRNKFLLFINMLANLSGEIINYSNVARALGVSQPTARDYFQIAHGTFIWRQLPSYEKNGVKRIVKHPKGYLRDSGLLHHLLRLADLDALLSHPGMGYSWESMVIENIIRGFKSMGIDFDSYYYRTSAGAEVDLVLEGEFGLLPIEIKYTQTVKKRDLKAIKDFIKERNCRLGLVINNDERVQLYEDNLIGIPFACL